MKLKKLGNCEICGGAKDEWDCKFCAACKADVNKCYKLLINAAHKRAVNIVKIKWKGKADEQKKSQNGVL